MKTIFIKLGTGFLYGVGFMIAAGIAAGMAYSFIESDIEMKQAQQLERMELQKQNFESMFREYDETAKLSVSVTKERIQPDEFVLLGVIGNNGDASWSSINLKAELFNEAGEFIDECSHFINQTSAPDSKINFKLSCGSCSKFELRDFKSYKLSIIDASFNQ
ncbi:MAG: hypothetical protein DWP95_02845 [Proteobacteria bacterium]|nr:MAG: hypothetical protein DWP95_02845 [Pseudomonadota bacterium]